MLLCFVLWLSVFANVKPKIQWKLGVENIKKTEENLKKGSIPDDQLKIDKEKIKSLGGLFVIGTERMESRRVDNQARGEADKACKDANIRLTSIFKLDDIVPMFDDSFKSNDNEHMSLNMAK